MISKHLEYIAAATKRIDRPITLMEICGTHTMAAFRSGLRSVLPKNIRLVSGPGCPVCVTPTEYVDKAVHLSRISGVVVTTFGDMLRVPGNESSLEIERAKGADVRIVFSPQDALIEAQQNPSVKVVFLGVGFETTAPAVAWTIRSAFRNNVSGFSVLSAHKTVPPVLETLLKSGEVKIDGLICPGHVSSIIGAEPYEFVARDHAIPCVVTGFEPADMVFGIEMLLNQIAEHRSSVEIQYKRGVPSGGNSNALKIMHEVFEECDVEWRGLGLIPKSGLTVREAFSKHDACKVFPDLPAALEPKNTGCICGEILRGVKNPRQCPLFRVVCTPASPVGACMVSSEGTCAAYYKYSDFGS